MGKKVIYSCEEIYFQKKKTHFDISTHTTILWKPEDLDGAAGQLAAMIRNTFPGEAKMEDD